MARQQKIADAVLRIPRNAKNEGKDLSESLILIKLRKVA